jgi:DnaK suppressor protein|tara:strand:- start:76 stop:405 length:330 start_codon:yes stop_codon:yes gene_type:complete
MLSNEEKREIQKRINKKIEGIDERILEYRELTKPIPPSVAIGRISRMDAINNKSVNEAALRQLEKQRLGLDQALIRLSNDKFGRCVRCGKKIPVARILLMPGATSCVRC